MAGRTKAVGEDDSVFSGGVEYDRRCDFAEGVDREDAEVLV